MESYIFSQDFFSGINAYLWVWTYLTQLCQFVVFFRRNWRTNANDDNIIIAEVDIRRVIRPHVFTGRPPCEVPKIKLIVIIGKTYIIIKKYIIFPAITNEIRLCLSCLGVIIRLKYSP